MLLKQVVSLKAKTNGHFCELRLFNGKENDQKLLIARENALDLSASVSVLRRGSIFIFSEGEEETTIEIVDRNLGKVNRFETLIRHSTDYASDHDDSDTEAYLSDTCSEISNFSFTSNVTTASQRRRGTNRNRAPTQRPLSMVAEHNLTDYGVF
ncbi:Oidioi.mRNA.OKI2018_I69.XSR.g15728.t1.cds [Oikopleura dioica]|uniref:Oidioi.mRNA.OKI2018_I69.XSR.g15728.t1.cds n=1 Tax=Oikopleura dioica TaxID=34765 RepID=A0ABN7SDR7_OIKDI|nr:Oidioi.mRNA.OKI2018_I69.XSR.g15728.t1.cds [Oikopleura dioica]